MFKFNSMFNLLYTNVNSYSPKRHLINHTIEKYDIKCALFVESKTKAEANTQYRNWNILRHDGNIANANIRGGSLVQAHPSLKLGKANPPCINNGLNDVIHCTIPFKEDKLHIFLVYIHPTSSIEGAILNMAARFKYTIIIGDFNVNNAAKKKQLNDFIRNTNFVKASTPPTFIMPNNNDTTPDLILHTKNISNNLRKIDVLPDIGADHLSIMISFDSQNAIIPEDPITKYKFFKCNIDAVNEEIIQYIDLIQNTEITLDTITNFNSKLQESILHNTPSSQQHQFTHELPPYIVKLIKYKRKIYREYQQNRNQDVKRAINDLNKNIHNLINHFKTHQWLEACQKINKANGRNFYHQVNKLSKYKHRKQIPTIEANGREYSTDKQKADIFAEQFKQNFSATQHPNFDDENFNTITEWCENYFNIAPTNDTIEVENEEYFNILSSQKNSAPGYDNIPWTVLKKLDYHIHLFIIKVFNHCITHHVFPDIWKKGQIIVIPKPNSDHSKANNYRPITLLPVLGKLLEKIIRNKIESIVRNKIPVQQFGFKEKCSTLHPLTILTSNVQTAKLNNLKSAALFLDIKKAFDSVWHKGLLYKLKQIEVPDQLVHLLKDFLRQRNIQVKINNAFSEEFTAEQGVPQGSSLSPLLYNVYCSDIYYHEGTPNQHSYLLQYADDTALIAHEKSINSTNEKIQTMMNDTQLWLNKWRLQVNPLKSQYVIFNHTPSINSPTIAINGLRIQPASTGKYLGVNLDNKLNFNYHTKMVKRKTITRAKHFRALTFKNKGINISTASKIYKTICRPLVEYGHPLFTNCRNTTLKNLRVAETSSLRAITKIRHPSNPLHNPSNALLYQKTKIQPIEERLKSLTKKFAQRACNTQIIQPLLIFRNNSPPRYTYPEKTIHMLLMEMAEEDP